MQEDHLATHIVFAHLPGPVIGIALACPGGDLRGHQTLVQFPHEKALASITHPQGAVAIEGGSAGLKLQNGVDKLAGMARP